MGNIGIWSKWKNLKNFISSPDWGGAGRRGEGARKVVLVFYVGGVTMAEVAALRWLSQVSKSHPA